MPRPQKVFTSLPQKPTTPSYLVEIQLNSFRRFLKTGLKELFEEVSPIKDYSEKELELWFEDYYFGEPKTTERKAKERGLSYEAPLRVKVRLQNRATKDVKTQEIYFGDFPMMTERGTFIVNGVERVVVSQLIRSSGVSFSMEMLRGRKLFGAKVMPNKGSWLELETDIEGAIYVRIDRKRRIPVSMLLRAFGYESDEQIEKLFNGVDTGKNADAIKFIKETIKKDTTKTRSEAFVEIYRRLRPGDLVITPENAKTFVEKMFFEFEHYDLGVVGRYRMGVRLYGKSSEEVIKKGITREDRTFKREDLIETIKRIITLNNDTEAIPDDIDHLGNRRVRAVGELLESRLRVGFKRLEKNIRDRMSTSDPLSLVPGQLVNSRLLMAVVSEFFTVSQLSQFMDQENPLSELEHKRRLSAMGPGGLTKERAGFEVRDVHPSHYGRICPIQTPEGPNIGLISTLSTFARVNDFGFIETPYYKVKNGKVTKEMVYLTADEEEKYTIAHGGNAYDKDGTILAAACGARINGIAGIAPKQKVDLIDVGPNQAISIATSLIPFLENDDANRALMGSNMQRQAVPSIRPDAPLVGSGMETKAAYDSGQVIIAEEDGEVAEVDASHIVVKETKGERKSYRINKFIKSNKFTSISQRPVARLGDAVKRGDILADGSSIKNGQIALGQNLLVAFVPFYGNNFEDAIVISERVLKEDRFTSIHIKDYVCDVRDTKLGPEITTHDISNVSEEKLKNLDEEGIIRIGAEVSARDILVGKISPKGESDLTPEERLLKAIFGEKAKEVKDTSLRVPHGIRGRVVETKIFSRDFGDKLESGKIKSVEVSIAQLRKVSVGDKLAGRHGNKGVISKVLPEEDMPYLEDGTPVDIVLNPLGVVSRMNIGQILETHLGWAAHRLGYQAITPVFAGATETMIKKELKEAGLPEDGKVTLYDGKTGEPFLQKVTVGMIYMMKLNHLAEDKIHMRSIGPYSLITQQPLGGKAQLGGQRFGEMEVWALEGYGAAHILQEMLTIKSDDVLGRTAAYDSIIRGEPIKNPSVPASFSVLVNELKALGLNVILTGMKDESAGEDGESAEGERGSAERGKTEEPKRSKVKTASQS